MSALPFALPDDARIFLVFGGLHLAAGGIALLGLAAVWPGLRRWLPQAIALLVLFIGLRVVSYPAAFHGGDHGDWPKFLALSLDDPRSPLSLVFFTAKAAIKFPAQWAGRVLELAGLPLPDPAYLLTNRFSGVWFDLILCAGLLLLAWRFMGLEGRSWLLFGLGACLALVPARVYMATTVTYNLLGEALLIIVLLVDIAVMRALGTARAALAGGGSPGSAASLLRLSLLTALFGLTLALLLGAKWLFAPLVLPFLAQFAYLAGREWSSSRREGGEEARLALLLFGWTAMAMLLFTLLFYILATAGKVLGSGGHFSENFAFFTNPRSAEGWAPLGRRLELLAELSLIPNVGVLVLAAAPLGFALTVARAVVRRQGMALLVHLWALGIFVQSGVSVFFSVDSSAMTRNTLLMAVILAYAFSLCADLGARIERGWGRVAGRLGMGMLALTIMIEVGWSGGLYAGHAIGLTPYIPLRDHLLREPPGVTVAGFRGFPLSVFESAKGFRDFDLTGHVTGIAATLDPEGNVPLFAGNRPDFWVLTSQDARAWGMGKLEAAQIQIEAAGYERVARFDALPPDLPATARLRPLFDGPDWHGLFQIGFIELWRNKVARD
jgi:hypothetical protein